MILKPMPKACPRHRRGASAEGTSGGRAQEGGLVGLPQENFEILVRFGAVWGLRSEILLVYLKIVFLLDKTGILGFLVNVNKLMC